LLTKNGKAGPRRLELAALVLAGVEASRKHSSSASPAQDTSVVDYLCDMRPVAQMDERTRASGSASQCRSHLRTARSKPS